MRMFGQSSHGRSLRELGFDGDLRYAAQLDIFESVPVLYHDGETKVLRTRPPREKQRAN